MNTTPYLENMFGDLKEEIIWLHCDWSQYQTLFGTSARRVDILNATAGIFFHDLQDIYINYVALRLARLVDRRRDVVSLERFCHELRKHNDAACLQSISRSFQNITRMSKPFEARRSRIIAHRNKAVAFGNETLPGISRQMVEEILAEIRAFMNLFSVAVWSTEVGFELLPMQTDTRALIVALKKAILYDEIVSNGQLAADHFRESHLRDA